MSTKNVTILGSTGSIGVNTLDVIARHPDRFRVFALSACSRIEELALQCEKFRPRFAALPDAAHAEALRTRLRAAGCQTEVLSGDTALSDIATDNGTDVVMAAIVGAAGLPSSLAAARAGKTVLLANKEALVMAGAIFMNAVRDSGATLLPIDSEHNAIFQSLPRHFANGLATVGVRKIILTASGGPFRTRPIEDLHKVTPDQACAHPNWVMGRKISVDSATMMNKGLEVIEAHHLFGIPYDRIEVVVHPQSVVHSFVEFVDGSVLAQLGVPSMELPVLYALTHPDRITDTGVPAFDPVALSPLTYEPVRHDTFPALGLGIRAGVAGGAAPAVFNAANEEAVARFLAGELSFGDIARAIASALVAAGDAAGDTLEALVAADVSARAHVREFA